MKAASAPVKPGRIEVATFWRCQCGTTTGVHRVYCDRCGDHRAACEAKEAK